jgi:hypothetical protein
MYNDTSVFSVQTFYRTRGNSAARTAVGTNDTIFTQNYNAYGDSGNQFVSLGYQENKVGTNYGNGQVSLTSTFAASYAGSQFNVSGYDNIGLNGNVTANYFSGDGSNITNVNSIQNGNSIVNFTGVDGDLNISTNNITNGVQVSGRQIQLNGANTGVGDVSSITFINGFMNWTLDNTNFGGGGPFGMNRYNTGFLDPLNYYTARGNQSSPADVQVGDAAYNERVQVRYNSTTHDIFNSDVSVRSFSPSNTVAATYTVASYDDQANSVFQVNFGTSNIAGDITATGNISVNSGNIVLQTDGSIDYNRVFGCFHKVANVTAAAANTIYNFDWYNNTTVHVGNEGVTVTSGNPTHINIDTAGSYEVFLV